LSSSSGASAPAKLLPGYYSGELADGMGTYDLLVDEGGETGYMCVESISGSLIGDCRLVIDGMGVLFVELHNEDKNEVYWFEIREDYLCAEIVDLL
jgi:hypothetical protein